MKHAVIPTDLTLQSLQPVHEVMRMHPDGPVTITLLHLVEMPDGIGDLLFRHRRHTRQHPEPEAFRQAREIMLNRYAGRLQKLEVDIRPCTSVAYLEHILEAQHVSGVFIPQTELTLTYADSVPVAPLLRRCRVCPIVECTDARQSAKPSLAGIGDLLLAN